MKRKLIAMILAAGAMLGAWADSHKRVQLWENGPYWATTNIGADEPWDSGYYFWWGDTIGYKWENNAWVASDGSSSDFSFESGNAPTYDKYVATLQSEGWITEDGVLAPDHDAAQAQLGGGWRMPTVQDLNDLCYNKCVWIWTTTNGVNGYLVRGKDEYSSASIFLPCTGYGSGNSRTAFSSHGYYWSSVPASWNNAGGIVYLSDRSDIEYSSVRYAGTPIRPVSNEPLVTVSVTFDENFEGGSTTNISFLSTSKVLANVPAVPARVGWELVGWFDAAEGGNQISADALPTDGATYYAHWQKVSYVAIGSGTAVNTVLPTHSFYKYSLTEQIYTSAEIGGACLMDGISFRSNMETSRSLDVYLVHTDKSAFGSSTDWIGVTASDKVFSGSVVFTADDWTKITFDTPFIYNGTDNLAVVVDDNTGTYVSGQAFYVFNAPGTAISVYSDGTNYDPAYASTYNGSVLDVKNQVRLEAAELVEVSVTFDENFEGGSTTNVSTYSAVKVLASAPEVSTRSGWTFIGWYTEAEGGEQVSADTLPTDGATYYAHWAEVSCDKVQLWEGGPYWAETNIGAENPWDSGYYFWWGDTIGYKWENNAWVASDGSSSDFSFESGNAPTYGKDTATLLSEGWITADGVLAPEHDAAHVQWGENWRMPTVQEMEALDNKCDWTLITTNGVYGFVVRGKGAYAPASIFLPCVGVGSGTSLTGVNSDGAYCSATLDRPSLSWSLLFGSADWHNARSNRYCCDGCSIRPVQNAPAPANQWTSGDCTVTLGSEGTLTVSGTGAMADEGLPPWKEKSDDIKKIVIEDGVTAIGIQAFSDLREATSVQIGKDVVCIGGGAFYDCTSLSGELALPNGLTAIGDYAFCQCQNLSGELLLPNGLITVEMYAFFGCKNFTTVKIPSTVTNIGAGVFACCTGITDVYCHPNAADLTWGGATSDFKSDGSTKIHVKESQLAAYQEKFPTINATFVGDLPEFEFTTDGDVLWTLQGDGSWYSGRIPGSNGDNWLTTTVTGSGILSFDWKILGADVNSVYIECYVDDERVGENYDEGWQTFTHELGEGEHSVTLYYCEDGDPSLPGGAWMKNFRLIQNSVTPDVSITAGEYFKATLAELGYDVPTDGQTPYTVKAYGLPAGLKLKSNAAVTKKVKKGKKTTTVVVTPAKTEWWIEGVPTAALDYATNPPYLVITANGATETLPLSLGVEAQDVMELDDLALGDQLNEQFYLPGVTNGWTVSGLPAGLKYTAKLVTTTKKKGKKVVSVTTNALPYSVYGKTTKAGLFTITAKKKTGAYYETLKFRVLVRPAPVDTAIFGDSLTNITTMAYVPFEWDLTNDVAAVGGKVAKVAGLPTGLAFASATTYKDKKKTQVKQYGQTIVGTPKKPGTYVVTFTKNVTTGTGKKKKTVAKTAQILWTVEKNDAEVSLGFNTQGGEIKDGAVGLNYGDLLAFSATDGAKVTASGLPKGITLANLGGGAYAFTGFTTKAGTYLVTVTATLNGKTVRQRVALKVDGLPSWAKGTYNGVVYATSGDLDYAGYGKVTVSAAGKISGKFSENGTNWTFSAASYTSRSAVDDYDDAFICTNVVAKYAYKVTEKVKGKKKTVTKYLTRSFSLTVAEEDGLNPARGMAMMSESDGPYVEAYQNLWGQTAYKALGKKLFTTKSGKKTLAYKTFTIKGTEVAGKKIGLTDAMTLSMKVTTAGAVTATLTYDTGKTKKDPKTKKTVKVYYKPTCATVAIPATAADVDQFVCNAFVYFAPSAANDFPGFAGWVPVISAPAGHDKVQLWEGGPYWATTNIGAEEPEDYGYYFWWGDVVGYKWENEQWVASDGSAAGFLFREDNVQIQTYGEDVATLHSEGWITAGGALAPEHDAAQAHWGGDWRMPTEQELQSLCSYCDWTWTTLNGVVGYEVRGKGDYASASIFLPCAGYGVGTSLYYAGSYGGDWSSVPYSDSRNARGLGFNSGGHDAGSSYRYYGFSVRPVQGFTE